MCLRMHGAKEERVRSGGSERNSINCRLDHWIMSKQCRTNGPISNWHFRVPRSSVEAKRQTIRVLPFLVECLRFCLNYCKFRPSLLVCRFFLWLQKFFWKCAKLQSKFDTNKLSFPTMIVIHGVWMVKKKKCFTFTLSLAVKVWKLNYCFIIHFMSNWF